MKLSRADRADLSPCPLMTQSGHSTCASSYLLLTLNEYSPCVELCPSLTRGHGVRDVIVIGPYDGVADFHRDRLRVEGEVVDLHLDVRRPGGARRRDYNGDKPSERAERESPCHGHGPQLCSGMSIMASRCSPCGR
jgi:hypothetical protein